MVVRLSNQTFGIFIDYYMPYMVMAKYRAKKELFLAGYNAMIERLQPEIILFYGKAPKECKGNIVQIKAFHERFEKEV